MSIHYQQMTEEQRAEESARCKAYRIANRERLCAHKKAYREANREKIKARAKAYRERNAEAVKARDKAYYYANVAKLRARYVAFRRSERKEAMQFKDAVNFVALTQVVSAVDTMTEEKSA